MAITELLIGKTVDFAINILDKHMTGEKKDADAFGRRAELALSSHLKYISNWSKSTQFATYGNMQDIETQSIELKFDSMPRMFRSKTSSSNKDESSLLSDNCNYLLLGDPGSGKTTTLKRIARKMLLAPEELAADTFAFPILIRLKELSTYRNINEIIAGILGFRIDFNEVKHAVEEEVEEEVPFIGKDGRQVIDKLTGAGITHKIRRTVTKTLMLPTPFIMDVPLADFISNYLDETNILVLIDGYDELESDFSNQFEKDIEMLARKLTTAKIIMTCRTGHCNQKLIEGFEIIDILPLDRGQIEMIAAQWLSIDGQISFFKNLDKVPYKDLADRPLFITLLLIIFQREGELPNQPSEVYKRIVDLLLKDWDADRKVIRKSQYAGFDKGKKALFLSELAFNLTCKLKLKRFSSEDLIAIYGQICGSFNLPKKEAVDVAREVESHSGLIVISGLNHYEFSHLSLQEYLCADYIVRAPLDKKLLELLVQYPEPVAVAIALSSNPSAWFSTLILNSAIFRTNEVNMEALTRRLLIEQPYFRDSKELGYALIALVLSDSQLTSTSGKRACKLLFSIKAMKASVRLYLKEKGVISISRYGKDDSILRFVLSNPSESNSNRLPDIYRDINERDLGKVKLILGLRNFPEYLIKQLSEK